MAAIARRTLTSRPLDLVYFAFFLIHIPATLLVDLQALYPENVVPSIVKVIPSWYVAMSGDPLIGGVMGFFANHAELAWFKIFLCLEAVFQLPTFVLGARGLWKDSRAIYVLLLIYGASTSTTTLACLAVLMNTPTTSPETLSRGIVSVTLEQRLMLLSSYVPFFLLPLYMTLDMAFRVRALVVSALRAEKASKGR
ncbi:hypothetical protein DENSPDRAFT_834657 [Dentipellis sp. KUC8613]|nr:hypothetical protein DENSPDRAFT_834657 [Dentipellis sp. KUC8613]